MVAVGVWQRGMGSECLKGKELQFGKIESSGDGWDGCIAM